MQNSNRSKSILSMVAAVALIAASALAYVYRSRIQLGLGLLVDETGSKTMAAVCLILGLFALFCLLLWMLFPILFYVGLKDLRRRTSELDETTKACARHLARLAEDSNGGGEQKSKSPPSTGSPDQII